MSQDAKAERPHKHFVVPIKIYAGVWAALIVLTIVTVKVSYFDFGVMNLFVAMGIATVKASLVVLFFMALKYDEPFNAIVLLSALGFLGVFFLLTLSDTMERGKVDPIEAEIIELVPARPDLMGEEAAPVDSTDGGH